MLFDFRYLDWSRALQDVNTAVSQTKPLVSVLFDKSTWHPEGHELGALLKSHGVCLDLSAGSGSALSHQYDQGQVNELISHCYGALYGTGDIHPPEPPRTPEHETQVRSRVLPCALSRALLKAFSLMMHILKIVFRNPWRSFLILSIFVRLFCSGINGIFLSYSYVTTAWSRFKLTENILTQWKNIDSYFEGSFFWLCGTKRFISHGSTFL